jgi:hypothetical protein
VRIVDATGWECSLFTSAALDVSALRPGLYSLLVVAADQPVLARRFCKQWTCCDDSSMSQAKTS